jgi:hypothetical protein
MTKLSNKIYQKIQNINRDVKEKLRRRGFVSPILQSDGSIVVGQYKIKKNQNNFFDIEDKHQRKIIFDINLPESAILIANDLALTNFLNPVKISIDKQYGYVLFDITRYNHNIKTLLKKQNYEKLDLMIAKKSSAVYKANQIKTLIESDYKKLLQLDK